MQDDFQEAFEAFAIFAVLCQECTMGRLTAAGVDRARTIFYRLEQYKRDLEQQLHALKLRRNIRLTRFTIPEDQVIRLLDSHIPNYFLVAQKAFREFLFAHQSQAFGVVHKHEITNYERLLYESERARRLQELEAVA